MPSLLGCHFFGFAFLPHEFQFALGFFEGGRDFLLHAGCGLFEFLRELDVAVVLHAGSGWDETADDDVFLEAAQAVHRTVDAGFGEDSRGLLEGGCGDEGVGRERGLGDAQQERTADGWTASLGYYSLVLFAEAELVDLLLEQEGRVADFLDLYLTQHLTDDGLDVLVRDGHALQAVDFLVFFDRYP